MDMNELSKKVIEVEKEYFSLLQEMFWELISIFEEEHLSVDETVKKYLVKQRQTTIFVPGYKDNHSFRRRQMYEKNITFWNKNKDTLIDFISSQTNVGIFGVGDNIFVSEYLNETKRNSLFYDVIVFNDPFYTIFATDKELDYESNIAIFYRNILYIWEIRRYLSIEKNEVFTIVFPFDILLTNEEKINIADESHLVAVSWINEIFGITSDENDFVRNLEKVKQLPIEKIQEKLYRNGIYQNYIEALNYSQNMLSEKEKKEIERVCFELWGTFNKDFVRCLLTLEALPSLATTNYYTYKLHFILAMRLKSNPIMSRNEWAPMQRELKNQSLKVSGDYMYTCAIHRNDQMASLMELDYDAIVKYHNRKQCADFRSLFYEATKEIVNTYVNVDEIAKEVFCRIDELLAKENQDILFNRKQTKKNAIIGFLKVGLGFVPILSYAISAFDAAISVKDYVKTLNNKETLVEYLRNRNTK